MAAHTVFPDRAGVVSHGAFTVQPVSVLDDNYAYILTDSATGATALVDPAEADRVLDALKASGRTPSVTHVLTTHKHWDHAQGNPDIVKAFPKVAVVGGEVDEVSACTQPVRHGSTFTIGQSTHVTVLFTPCHTRGHVLYHVTSTSPPSAAQPGVLFTGDTLFIAGAGKFFEGTAAQMHHNLNTTIAKLPDATALYVGSARHPRADTASIEEPPLYLPLTPPLPIRLLCARPVPVPVRHEYTQSNRTQWHPPSLSRARRSCVMPLTRSPCAACDQWSSLRGRSPATALCGRS